MCVCVCVCVCVCIHFSYQLHYESFDKFSLKEFSVSFINNLTKSLSNWYKCSKSNVFDVIKVFQERQMKKGSLQISVSLMIHATRTLP